MKKRWLLLCTSLMLVFILAACGTTSELENPTTENVNEEVDNQDNEVNEEQADEAIKDAISEENDNDTENVDRDDETEKEDQSKKEMDEEDKTTSEQNANALAGSERVNSDMQDYSLDLLPEYTLTSEEPGRDSLFFDEDDAFFMRIETMSPDEVDIEDLKENTIQLLEGSSNGKTPEEIESAKLPSNPEVKNMIGYTVQIEEDIISGLVFEKDKLIVRLTIFDNIDEAYFKDFSAMGLSIQKD